MANTDLVPCDLAAEIAVLGSMVIEPACVADVSAILSPETFYNEAHDIIANHIFKCVDKSPKFDALILHSALVSSGSLEAIGGFDYIRQVLQSVPSAANVMHYAEIVREKWQLRSMMQACATGLREAREGFATASAIIDAHQAAISKLSEAAAPSAAVDVAERLPEVLRILHGEADVSAYGLQTGFVTVDGMIGGMRPSEVILLGSHTNHGKTALALNIAAHVAIQQQTPAAIVSLEMTRDEVTERLILAQCGLSKSRIREGLTVGERHRLDDATDRLLRAGIIIDDTGRQTIPQMRAKARALKRKHNIGLLVIDYVQLVEGENRRDPRRDQLVEISRAIKLLAKDLELPILVLSQLNRESAKDDRLPSNWDLAECAAFERDANVILLLDREYARKRNNPVWMAQGHPRDDATLQVSKNRGGELGTVDLKFKGYCLQFQEATIAVSQPQDDLYSAGGGA